MKLEATALAVLVFVGLCACGHEAITTYERVNQQQTAQPQTEQRKADFHAGILVGMAVLRANESRTPEERALFKQIIEGVKADGLVVDAQVVEQLLKKQ